MNTAEAVRRLRQHDLMENADLIGQYDSLEANYSLQKLDEELDAAISDLTARKSSGLSQDEIESITGFDPRQQALLNKRKASGRVLDPALGHRLTKRDERIAFAMLSKRYFRNGNLRETLQYSIDEFADCMSEDELASLQRAAKSLDLSLFVQLLGDVFSRVRATAL